METTTILKKVEYTYTLGSSKLKIEILQLQSRVRGANRSILHNALCRRTLSNGVPLVLLLYWLISPSSWIFLVWGHLEDEGVRLFADYLKGLEQVLSPTIYHTPYFYFILSFFFFIFEKNNLGIFLREMKKSYFLFYRILIFCHYESKFCYV